MGFEIETAVVENGDLAADGGAKIRTDVAAIRDAIVNKLTYAIGKRVVTARPRDWFVATALTVRDRVVERWIATNDETLRTRRKRVYYLSLEFLIGRLLIDALTSMEMIEPTRAALAELGVDLEELRELEPDAALGNGGLGRLAACFMESVNSDPTVRGLLKVVFLSNYNVSLAERIIPAADLSEQISTAGMEASGTGNMKFALNGALTIGTLDGANVEIREKVGAENIFIFGLTAEEVKARRRQGIDGQPAIERSVKLAEVLDAVASGVFSPDEPDRYRGLVDMLVHNDYFLVTADFDSYYETQRAVFRRWRDKHAWWQAAALNTARMGWFSSDRTISEYAEEIWDVPVPPTGKR